mmetsp:Transcript_8415/g.38274  ORF Transcript_8415/g.38274 Transcript_8415/m.38274 type:complete len:259 (-) Transcript_8415:1033-1809(-)
MATFGNNDRRSTPLSLSTSDGPAAFVGERSPVRRPDDRCRPLLRRPEARLSSLCGEGRFVALVRLAPLGLGEERRGFPPAALLRVLSQGGRLLRGSLLLLLLRRSLRALLRALFLQLLLFLLGQRLTHVVVPSVPAERVVVPVVVDPAAADVQTPKRRRRRRRSRLDLRHPLPLCVRQRVTGLASCVSTPLGTPRDDHVAAHRREPSDDPPSLVKRRPSRREWNPANRIVPPSQTRFFTLTRRVEQRLLVRLARGDED